MAITFLRRLCTINPVSRPALMLLRSVQLKHALVLDPLDTSIEMVMVGLYPQTSHVAQLVPLLWS
ncbi:MAG: uncharacterized protein KVP18_001533 [Porospora cf. gigantea A]|nr:MAG: hypothetical protein KVP18_001533 [Porospora cf. gigantea A]